VMLKGKHKPGSLQFAVATIDLDNPTHTESKPAGRLEQVLLG